MPLICCCAQIWILLMWLWNPAIITSRPSTESLKAQRVVPPRNIDKYTDNRIWPTNLPRLHHKAVAHTILIRPYYKSKYHSPPSCKILKCREPKYSLDLEFQISFFLYVLAKLGRRHFHMFPKNLLEIICGRKSTRSADLGKLYRCTA